jgi:hypothetical protein
MHKTFIINWQGPYELTNNGKKPGQQSIFFKGGLYLFTGIAKNKQKEKLQYIGIAEATKNGNSYFERFKRHSRIPEINRNLKAWLGKIVYPNSKNARSYLEVIEGILIYYCKPEINIMKKYMPPEELTIINRWYKPSNTGWSDEPRFNKPKILNDLDDVISWDGSYWRSANKLAVLED